MTKPPKSQAKTRKQPAEEPVASDGHPQGVLSARDALRIALDNEQFSADLRNNPEKYQKTFNLSDGAVAMLKRLDDEDVRKIRELAGKDKEGFVAAMGAMEKLLTRQAKAIFSTPGDGLKARLQAYAPTGPYQEN